ncbi:uncharacterized protein FFB14_05025 [Fusarium fujikuroi]|nr:uncharacterized protein FFB14_05025 [Fusarium fujikuroi]
MHLSAY